MKTLDANALPTRELAARFVEALAGPLGGLRRPEFELLNDRLARAKYPLLVHSFGMHYVLTAGEHGYPSVIYPIDPDSFDSRAERSSRVAVEAVAV